MPFPANPRKLLPILTLQRSPKETYMLLLVQFWPPPPPSCWVMVSNLQAFFLFSFFFSVFSQLFSDLFLAYFLNVFSTFVVSDIGVMSGAVIYIKDDLKISDTQVEILAGILNLYCLIGSCAAGRTSDWIGRRYTIVVSQSIFFAGAILMGFATNYSFLMVGRFVAGVGVGYALMIAPVYTAEVSPASTRGFLSSFPEVRSTRTMISPLLRTILFSEKKHNSV
jgi:MFS family permease